MTIDQYCKAEKDQIFFLCEDEEHIEKKVLLAKRRCRLESESYKKSDDLAFSIFCIFLSPYILNSFSIRMKFSSSSHRRSRNNLAKLYQFVRFSSLIKETDQPLTILRFNSKEICTFISFCNEQLLFNLNICIHL